MSELSEGGRIRELIPPPGRSRQLADRRERRRQPAEPPPGPPARTPGEDDRPHIDEYA